MDKEINFTEGHNFELNQHQQLITDMIRRYGEKKLRPVIMKYDESQEFPIEILKN